ncbi:DUF6492 family protein [Pseudopelagicola sp. nBUS_20]|uniref:DUF6492 family protein n=1 Tax=Pseudopelagicola sp. nBUS_20 TaxID=3395317 RepID=UPI003EBC2191
MSQLASQLPSLVMVTCSMTGDKPLFAQLAASIDDHISKPIRHLVVVPSGDVASFSEFANPWRMIVAQDEFLPWHLIRLPTALGRLAPLFTRLRRPLYLTSRFQPVRGWIVQQLLKLEIARQATESAVMHVDSDVMFYRDLTAVDVFPCGRPAYFSVPGNYRTDTSIAWTRNAALALGIDAPDAFGTIYVENCVPWSAAVVRRMLAHIEAKHGRRFQDVLVGMDTVSEYHMYGMYLDLIEGHGAVAHVQQSFCNSLWPGDDPEKYLDLLAARSNSQHFAIAVQSTEAIALDQRRILLEQARVRLEQ